MKIVIDSNILIAALIKDSFIREKIVNFESELVLPQVSLEEI